MAAFVSDLALAHARPATVISVTDGHTVRVAPRGDTSTPVSVRLYGVATPESG